jgi:hypothetical protein
VKGAPASAGDGDHGVTGISRRGDVTEIGPAGSYRSDVAKKQEKAMGHKGRMVWMGVALAALSASAQALDCDKEHITDCAMALQAPGCGSGGTELCEPIIGGLIRLGWASRVALDLAAPGDRVLAMRRHEEGPFVALTVDITIGDGLQLFAGIGEMPPPQLRGARVSASGAAGASSAPVATVAYLASPVFGGVMRDPQDPAPAYAVRLDSPSLNGNPNAIVVATRVRLPWTWSSATGAYYDGAYWWLYNESLQPMAANEMFFYAEATGHGGRAVHTAQNDFAGIGVYLDDPMLNGKPSAVFVAQHAFAGALNASPLAAWYDAGRGQWVVFNELGAPLAAGEQIHYMIAP